MKKQHLAVALSGGVDSSVAALILKNEGFDVVGFTMQLLPKDKEKEFGGCCGTEAIETAKKVARKLGIKHYVLNFRDIFRETVIENFLTEYRQGRTPNPCLRCNQFIKFDALIKRAEEIDARFIATGHYARIDYDKNKKGYLLKKAKDKRKDQSYVLFCIKQKQLKKILFPLGDYLKDEVVKIAERENLPSAFRKESQEICFIPDNNYPKFIKRQIKEKIEPGPILGIEGNKIGQHKGLIYYTIGQRRGLGVSAKKPLYVIDIDRSQNTITVGEEKYLYAKEFRVNKINFTSIKRPHNKFKAKVKIRYLHRPAWATVYPETEDNLKIIFNQSQQAITPGQAAVFYNKDVVLGGGTIGEVRRAYER
jgi:tRNA-uridine 2-sulfurtransferase